MVKYGIIAVVFIAVVVLMALSIKTKKTTEKQVIEKSEEDRMQEEESQAIKRAKYLQLLLMKATTQYTDNQQYNKPIVIAQYKSKMTLKDISDELVRLTESQGKVEAIAEELTKGGYR